uniref:Globin domain-containing protein n=1 Tax=Cynoglossus semilaevis TaxID=244447 RepID=A0A3P8UEU3_CYNSE
MGLQISNPMIAAHGIRVLHGLDRAVKNMDNIKATYAELSVLHSEKLHVDPDNFKVKRKNQERKPIKSEVF